MMMIWIYQPLAKSANHLVTIWSGFFLQAHIWVSLWYFRTGVSGNSRSRSFPRMEASDSLPEFREWIFFIPFPFPNFGNGFFSFPSLPEFWELILFIPFPFPNFGNGFFPFPSRSRIDPFKVGNQKGKWEILRD